MKSTGYIINGVYKKSASRGHGSRPHSDMSHQNITYRAYSHDRQREEHRRDILQPYDRNGKLSPEFVEQYPEEAKENYGFNQEQTD